MRVLEIYERIRLLRKDKLKMSQERFGHQLGVKRDVINNIENNRLKNPEQKEPLYKLICKEFNVNEEWLQTGIGGDDNIFIPEDMIHIQNAGALGSEKNEFKKFYLNMMMGLPDEYWDYIYNEFKKFEKKGE